MENFCSSGIVARSDDRLARNGDYTSTWITFLWMQTRSGNSRRLQEDQLPCIQIADAELPSPVRWFIKVFKTFDPLSDWRLSPHRSHSRFKQPRFQHLIQNLNTALVPQHASGGTLCLAFSS